MASPSASSGQLASRRDISQFVLVVLGTLVILCVLATSCVHHVAKSTAATPSATPTVTVALPVEIRIGVVRAVGARERFVLIETPSASAGSSLTEGQLLHSRPPGAEKTAFTADLRVAPERHQSLIVANVVAGEPEVGAVVYAEPVPAASPAPGSISSVSTAPFPGLFPTRKP